jgi:capsular polysaccharide biosynthesis protein
MLHDQTQTEHGPLLDRSPNADLASSKGDLVLYDVQPNGRGYTHPPGMGPHPNVPTEISQNEYVFSLEGIFQVIRRQIWSIAMVVTLLTGAAVGIGLVQAPTYEASIKILIGQKQDGGAADLGSNVLGLQQLTQTMAAAVNTRPVAKAVIQQLDLRESPKDLLENMSVSPVANTQFIEVSYRDASPEQAQQIANAIGQAFSEQVSVVSPSANAITATVWEQAVIPVNPVSPDPARNGLIALMLSSILGVTLAFLLEYRNDRWRSPDEVEQISGVPNIGVIRTFDAAETKKRRD